MSDRKVDPIKTINKLISEKQALSDELEAAKAENKKLQALLKALDIKIETAEDNKKNTPINDEDIRKALDCCITKDCDKCPFTVFLCDDRYALIWAQDLLDRQDAELERLSLLVEGWKKAAYKYADSIDSINLEAIKVFWNKLKERNTLDNRILCISTGDNLIKEMEGIKNAQPFNRPL